MQSIKITFLWVYNTEVEESKSRVGKVIIPWQNHSGNCTGSRPGTQPIQQKEHEKFGIEFLMSLMKNEKGQEKGFPSYN